MALGAYAAKTVNRSTEPVAVSSVPTEHGAGVLTAPSDKVTWGSGFRLVVKSRFHSPLA